MRRNEFVVEKKRNRMKKFTTFFVSVSTVGVVVGMCWWHLFTGCADNSHAPALFIGALLGSVLLFALVLAWAEAEEENK